MPFGNASAEGLGPGVSEALKALHNRAQANNKSAAPAAKKSPTKAPQFADAPYSMGKDAGAGASEAPESQGVDA